MKTNIPPLITGNEALQLKHGIDENRLLPPPVAQALLTTHERFEKLGIPK